MSAGITDYIKELVDDAIYLAGGKSALARKLNLRPGTVGLWAMGVLPRSYNLEALEKFVQEEKERLGLGKGTITKPKRRGKR